MASRPNLVAQQDIDEAQGRDRVAEAQVTTARAAVAANPEQVEVARANRNRARTVFAYARITAPFAGVITRRYADVGAMIQAGTASQTQTMPLVRLSDNSLLRLVIQVPESSAARIRVGAPVQVSVQALGRTFPGTVARFANGLKLETRTMDTEVDVPNPKFEIVPGMYASASIAVGVSTGTLTVPVEALERKDDKTEVLAVDGAGRLQWREVRLGLELPTRVEITSGLREGDLVVVGSRAQLKAGSVVAPKVVTLSTGEGVR
jgi:RND family efflux transporter MFP subunit